MRKWIVDHSKGGKRFGIHIEAISSKDAQKKAELMGLKNVEVMGKLIAIIFESSRIDYDIIQSN